MHQQRAVAEVADISRQHLQEYSTGNKHNGPLAAILHVRGTETILGDASAVGARSPGRHPALSIPDPSGGYMATRLLSRLSGLMNLHG